jgi:hypothetical protein
VILAVFKRLCGFCGFLARHEQSPTELDIFAVVIYVSSTMVGGKIGTKMFARYVPPKSKFLYFYIP